MSANREEKGIDPVVESLVQIFPVVFLIYMVQYFFGKAFFLKERFF
jgi:hypothetical protein